MIRSFSFRAATVCGWVVPTIVQQSHLVGTANPTKVGIIICTWNPRSTSIPDQSPGRTVSDASRRI